MVKFDEKVSRYDHQLALWQGSDKDDTRGEQEDGIRTDASPRRKRESVRCMLGEKWTRASLVIPAEAVNKRELKAAPHTHKRGADSSSLWEEQDGTRGRRRVLEVGLGGVPPERGFVLAPSGRPAWWLFLLIWAA